MSDLRPANCTFRLKDEHKPYPKSGCKACGKTVGNGLGKECSLVGTPKPDRFPPRIAAELEKGKAVGCRAIPVWNHELDSMADRSERAETSAAELRSIVHDLLHVVIGMRKALETYAPAVAISFKADADGIFERWAKVQRDMEPDEKEGR